MNESWLGLEGKTVIVTGGASGIGKAVAQEFLNVGCNVVVSDMAPEAPEFDTAAGRFHYVKTDVTSAEDVDAMVKEVVDTFGTVDVLVNNAGINIPRLLVDPKEPKGQYELDEAVWDKMCGVNFKGSVLLCTGSGQNPCGKRRRSHHQYVFRERAGRLRGTERVRGDKERSEEFPDQKLGQKELRETGSARSRRGTGHHGSDRIKNVSV